MKLGKLYPEKFKVIKRIVKRMEKEREKALEIETAWRIHLRRQGEHPRGSLIAAEDASLQTRQ